MKHSLLRLRPRACAPARPRSAARLLPLVLGALLLGGVGIGGRDARAAGEEKLSYAASGHVTLDPAHLQRENDERLVLALYDGLTALDPASGAVVPAAAARWEEAADGRSWTFHLRPGARWSDGTLVTARDFVKAWERAIDPYEKASTTELFRPLAGCAAILDGNRAMYAYDAAVQGLEKEMDSSGGSVPGKRLREILEGTGVAILASSLDDPAVKRMLRWGDDPFPAAKLKEATKALDDARRQAKHEMNDALDAFEKDTVTAPDDQTVVVHLAAPFPGLPRLVARAAFVPLHPSTIRRAETAFEASDFVGNGAYGLKSRGAKPRPGLPNPMSGVEIVRSKTYDGPNPGAIGWIQCWTDRGFEEDLRQLQAGETSWLTDVGAQQAKMVEKLPGFDARPAGEVLLIRFRVDRPPFDDLETRRAFALAINRKALADRQWPRAEVADRLVDPALPDVPPGVRAPEGKPDDAKAAYEKAGWKKKEFPWVELQFQETPTQQEEPADLIARLWKYVLGAEVSPVVRLPSEMAAVHAAGAFTVSVAPFRPATSDPASWLLPFRAGRPDGALGWHDDTFESLMDAALDLDALLAGGDAALAKLPGDAALRAKVAAARTGGPSARDALRLALLGAAEQRLLDQCVVVPVLRPFRAEVRRGVSGIGEEAAWRHPGFVGSLRAAHR